MGAAVDQRGRRQIDPGRVHVIETSAAPADPAERQRRVREIALALGRAVEDPKFRLPLLPETAAEALQLANDPSTPMNRLERVVSRDTALAARMLTVATSPAYAGTGVRSLTAALQRLGSGAVRDILYQAVMECHVFRGNERAVRAEREHAVAVGAIARSLSGVLGFDPQYTFVCGLLHDLGRTAIHTLRDHEPLAGAADILDEIAEIVHPNLGAHMAARWKLPALVIEGVRRHHRYRDFDEQGGYSQIGHVLAVSNLLAHRLGLGRPPAPETDAMLAPIYELGLDPVASLELAQAAVRA